MHLDHLKPAWKQFKLLNAQQSIESEEILSIIAYAEELKPNRLRRVLWSMFIFIIITLFCQSDELIYHLGG